MTCKNYFNSRPPHGGRHSALLPEILAEYFNSRPPHGGRPQAPVRTIVFGELQLTTSTRRSTFLRKRRREKRSTSTHDLHTEVDNAENYSKLINRVTSTHDLHTEVDRQPAPCKKAAGTSTHDLHTEVDKSSDWILAVSTILQLTTSTRRSTLIADLMEKHFGYFNSRPPHGGRPIPESLKATKILLQLTTSTRRSTAGRYNPARCAVSNNHFNSRPPHGGRHIIILAYF